MQGCDAKRVTEYLRETRSTDPGMFWSHIVDSDGRLKNLFWCDGMNRMDYVVFGDVMAFDATYRQNKYMCPLVVFCGVNHHNQSVIFGSAIVANESEETYVWLLGEFFKAMNCKAPVSIITDGDVAMKNAIGRVFPNARHRLCAWHLLKKARSHVVNTKFKEKLQKFIFVEYDVADFEEKWEKMTKELGVEDHV
jgi:transposase-like protein